MSTMKKWISLILAALLLVSMLPVGAFADEAPAITATATATAALNIGDTLEVEFKMTNNPGFGAAEFTLQYDKSVFSFRGLKQQEDEDSGTMVLVGVLKTGSNVVNKKTGKITWANATEISAKSPKLFVAQFEVVGVGDSTVGLTVDLLKNNAGTEFKDQVTVTKSSAATINGIPATSVTLDVTELALEEENYKLLSATVLPENTTDKVTWSSSNTAVATVTNVGKVTAVKEGTATITAKAGDKEATCTVTVSKETTLVKRSPNGYSDFTDATMTGIKQLYINGGNRAIKNIYKLNLTGHEWFFLCAHGTQPKAYTLEYKQFFGGSWGEKLTQALVNYNAQSINTRDLLVTKADLEGKLQEADKSKLDVTDGNLLAFMYVESDVNYGILFEITPVVATAISIDETLALDINESETLAVSVTPSAYTDTASVTWESSDATVASVDSDGKVTGLKAGTATITATRGSLTDTCAVTVFPEGADFSVPANDNYGDRVTELTISGVTVTGYKWDDHVMTAYITETDATMAKVTFKLSAAPNTVSTTANIVDSNGSCTVNIETSEGSRLGNWGVTFVKAVPTTSLSLNKETLTLEQDATETLVATLSEGANDIVKWSSSNDKVAAVDQTGKVTGCGKGTATITATAGSFTAICAVTVNGDYVVENIPTGSTYAYLGGLTIGGAEVESATWDGYTLNVFLASGTADGTEVKVKFNIKVANSGFFQFGDDFSEADMSCAVSATLADGTATISRTLTPYDSSYVPSSEETYTLKFTVAASAQPEPEVTKYDVTIADCENGTVTANVDKAAKGEEVRLTINPASGYALATLTVMAGEEPVALNGDCFTMPESAVTVTATFREIPAGYTVALGDDAEVSVGEKVKVEVTVGHTDSNVTKFNAYDLTLTYNATLLKLTTESSETMTVTAKDGTARILRYGSELDTGSKVTLEFEALKAGTAAVQLTKTLVDISENAKMANAKEATIVDGTQNVTIGGYTVTLPDDFTEESGVKPGYDYIFAPKDAYYDYELEVKMGDGTATAEKQDNGSYVIKNVTGNLVITVKSKTGKSFDVTLNGLTGDAKATHGTAYVANVTTQAGYTYTISATMGDDKYTGFTYDATAQTVTIPGDDIIGNISITATGTPPTTTGYAVTFAGSGASDATGEATATPNETYSFTLNKVSGYTYTVTAKMGEDPATVTEGDDKKTYTIANVTGNLTITIAKEPDVTVEVLDYLTISQGETGKKVFLVRATGSLDGYTYDGSPMYKTTAYAETGHWVYLVITGGTLTADDAKAKIAVGTATAEKPLEKTFDVNETGLVDVNDAQLVYNIYNNKYQDFETVSMKKFLKADTNADGKVDTQDAIAVIGSMNKSTAG